MRQIALAIMMAALAVAAIVRGGGDATAAPGRVFHSTSRGSLAEADWHFRSGNTRTDAFIFAFDGTGVATFAGRTFPTHGLTVFFEVDLFNLDPDGNISGGVQTAGLLSPDLGSTGYSASFDPLLRTAVTAGSGVPVRICTFGPDLVFDCEDSTADFNASWTGQGQIVHRADIFHDRGDFLSNTIVAGSFREAIATVTIAGTAFPVTAGNGLLAREAEADVFTCIGRYC